MIIRGSTILINLISGGPKLQSIFQEELTMRLRTSGELGSRSTLSKLRLHNNMVIQRIMIIKQALVLAKCPPWHIQMRLSLHPHTKELLSHSNLNSLQSLINQVVVPPPTTTTTIGASRISGRLCNYSMEIKPSYMHAYINHIYDDI